MPADFSVWDEERVLATVELVRLCCGQLFPAELGRLGPVGLCHRWQQHPSFGRCSFGAERGAARRFSRFGRPSFGEARPASSVAQCNSRWVGFSLVRKNTEEAWSFVQAVFRFGMSNVCSPR